MDFDINLPLDELKTRPRPLPVVSQFSRQNFRAAYRPISSTRSLCPEIRSYQNTAYPDSARPAISAGTFPRKKIYTSKLSRSKVRLHSDTLVPELAPAAYTARNCRATRNNEPRIQAGHYPRVSIYNLTLRFLPGEVHVSEIILSALIRIRLTRERDNTDFSVKKSEILEKSVT